VLFKKYRAEDRKTTFTGIKQSLRLMEQEIDKIYVLTYGTDADISSNKMLVTPSNIHRYITYNVIQCKLKMLAQERIFYIILFFFTSSLSIYVCIKWYN
jgi:hypothetical protein